MALEWRIERGHLGYPAAVAAMEERVRAIREDNADELVWLVEHPPLYTAGTSAAPDELLEPDRFPTYHTGRGGRWTYHGPGQRVAYVLLDLQRRGVDLRAHVTRLEAWAIATLAHFGIRGERRAGRVGIWVVRPDGREDKIAAVGVRVRRWVTYHGISINVAPDLTHFSGIVPCGIGEHGVTSLADQGVATDLAAVDRVLREGFTEVFGDSASQAGTPARLIRDQPVTSSLV